MISRRLEKIFEKKVAEIDDKRDRLIILYYLCKRGTATEITAQFDLKRQTVYEIMDKYKYLGISSEYRRTMWQEDFKTQSGKTLMNINWSKRKK